MLVTPISKLLPLSTLFLIIIVSPTTTTTTFTKVSKDQVSCEMCTECENPCQPSLPPPQQPQPPVLPPPPPSPSPPPPVVQCPPPPLPSPPPPPPKIECPPPPKPTCPEKCQPSPENGGGTVLPGNPSPDEAPPSVLTPSWMTGGTPYTGPPVPYYPHDNFYPPPSNSFHLRMWPALTSNLILFSFVCLLF